MGMSKRTTFAACQVVGLILGVLSLVTSHWLVTPSGLLGITNAGLWSVCSAGDNSTVLSLLEAEVAESPEGGVYLRALRVKGRPLDDFEPLQRPPVNTSGEEGSGRLAEIEPADAADQEVVTASEGPTDVLREWIDAASNRTGEGLESLVTEVQSSLPWSSDPFCTNKNIELFFRNIRGNDYWGFIQATRATKIISLVAGLLLIFSLAARRSPYQISHKMPPWAHFWWAVQVGAGIVAIFIFLGMTGRIVGAGLDIRSFDTYELQYKKVRDFVGWSYWVSVAYTGWTAFTWMLAILSECAS